MVGYNEPDLLIRKHLLGEQITPRFPYKSGFVLRGLQETFIEKIDFPKAVDIVKQEHSDFPLKDETP